MQLLFLGGLPVSEATVSTEGGQPGWGDGSSHPVPSRPAGLSGDALTLAALCAGV